MNMKRLGTAALIGLVVTMACAEEPGVITNFNVSIQFKDGTMGGIAIPWILDTRNAEYCEKAVVGLQIGNTNDIWFISTDVVPIVATNERAQSYVLPKK